MGGLNSGVCSLCAPIAAKTLTGAGTPGLARSLRQAQKGRRGHASTKNAHGFMRQASRVGRKNRDFL